MTREVMRKVTIRSRQTVVIVLAVRRLMNYTKEKIGRFKKPASPSTFRKLFLISSLLLLV